jgi:hypothetical protein
MSDDLFKHEVEDLMETLEAVMAVSQERRDKGEHIPPALQMFAKALADNALEAKMSVRQATLFAFCVGLKQGEKGKKLEDFTKCPC